MADKGISDALPVAGLLITDPDNLHARQDARLGHDGRRAHLTNHRFYRRHANHEHQPEGKQGKDEVGHGASRNDGHPGPYRFVIEGILLVTGFELIHPAIEHLDVATQRDQGQHVFGAVLAKTTPDRLAKTDGETLNLYAATAGNPEVAKLVHCDQQAKGNDKGPDIPQHTAHQPSSSIKV